jgi:hypothetical protein
MQLSLVSGVTTNEQAEFELAYPVNLEPVIVNSKISNGQLRTAAGTIPFGAGPGIDRGGINWNDVCYRVMGLGLVRVDANGTTATLGMIPGTDAVGLDYSFDRLIIRADGKLFYCDGTTVTQVLDVDLGRCVDAIWIDGYTMSTDGKFVVVTELDDAYQVKPTKYGSAEADPDPITGLIRIRGEAHVIGRHTIQVLQNVGGTGFPFSTIQGATIPFGCVSATAKTLFGKTYAFVGSARGDALGVYVAGQGTADKISTRAVDDWLSSLSNPAAIVCERRVARDEYRLLVHGEGETWIFLAKASEAAGESIWYRARSGTGKPYRPRFATNVYGKTIVGDTESPALAILTTDTSSHFDETTEWMFDVGLLYNQAKGAIIDRIELVGMSGRGDETEGSAVFMSMTRDGRFFSEERTVTLGKLGERTKRIQWRPHARMRSYMGLRFRGYSRALGGFAACEATVRPLAV